MKDKTARAAIATLAERLGCEVTYYDSINKGSVSSIQNKGDKFYELEMKLIAASSFDLRLQSRIMALEAKFAAQEESAKPVCKSCGQKIQEGLQVGNVEALAAGLKKGGNSKK